MESFKDALGREWKLELLSGHVTRIMKEFGLNILDNEQLFEFFFQKRIQISSIIWIICEKQAEKLGIEPEDFVGAFSAETFEAVHLCLHRELLNFSRGRKIAEVLMKNLPAQLEAAEDILAEGISSQIKSIVSSGSSAES